MDGGVLFWRYVEREFPDTWDHLRDAIRQFTDTVEPIVRDMRRHEHARHRFEKQAATLRRRQARKQNRRRN